MEGLLLIHLFTQLLIHAFTDGLTAQLPESSGLARINGTYLYFEIRGHGEPLVFIHGGPGLSHDYFLPYVAALSDQYKLVLYDQRASGRSAVPSPDSVSMKFLAQDLEQIRKELRVDKLKILAHSWGALLAAQYARNYPSHVARMVLVSPTPLSHDYDQQMADEMAARTTREDSIAMDELRAGPVNVSTIEKMLKLTFGKSAYNTDNVRNIDFHLQENYMLSSRVLYAGLQRDLTNYNYYDSLSSLVFPLLIVTGSADIIPVASVERLKGLSPRTLWVTFDKSGHFPFAEEQDAFIDSVREFFKK